MRYLLLIYITVIGLVLSGCGNEPEQASSEVDEPVTLSGDERVLARVNGAIVTQYDLDSTSIRVFGAEQAALLDENARRRLLESLVTSRAMAKNIEGKLNAEERERMNKEVAAYRESLLLREYVRRHSTVKPVSDEMVRNYYEQNPQRFGGITVRRYEMIAGTQKLPAAERDVVISSLAGATKHKNWQQLVDDLKKQGIKLQYRKGEVNEGLLHPQLFAIIKPLKLDETSKLSFVQGRPYLVRIVEETSQPPRPLSEVRAEIRRSLGPIQVKKAVEQATNELMKTVKIEYLDTKNAGDR